MPEQLPFTALLNRLFAVPVTNLLQALHIHPEYPQAPITNPVAMQILVVLGLAAAFALIRMRLSVERPGGLQHVAGAVSGAAAVPDRSGKPSCARAFAYCAFVRQHVCRRNGDAGFFLAGTGGGAGDFYGASYRRGIDSDVYFCLADLRVSGWS